MLNRWLGSPLGTVVVLVQIWAASSLAAQCVPDTHRLCMLDDRFALTLQATSQLGLHTGTALPSSDDDGAFYLFEDSNYEIVVKMIDGRDYNGAFWVFYGPLTSLNFDLEVVDTSTGIHKTFKQRGGQPVSHYDTYAFPTVGGPPPRLPEATTESTPLNPASNSASDPG
ncbi:MAG: hypothetical protein K8J08_09525, partial [Thermoanaerobaculia bacterium]|nr:hypothetical protein [Thermoanaerobaculia bacterium]